MGRGVRTGPADPAELIPAPPSSPVHVTRFSPTNTEIMSCSDDTTVKLWDVPSQTALRTFTGHTDYVRAGHFIPSNPALLLSGSYDSTVRLWDARAPDSEGTPLVLRHGGAPVEDVLPFASGGAALSVGGPILRVWDLAAGRCVRALSNHQKTVTCVAHTMRYPAPILSLAVSVSGDPPLVYTNTHIHHFPNALAPAARQHTHRSGHDGRHALRTAARPQSDRARRSRVEARGALDRRL